MNLNEFVSKIADRAITGSSIPADLWAIASKPLSNYEVLPGGEVENPLYDALNRKINRFGENQKRLENGEYEDKESPNDITNKFGIGIVDYKGDCWQIIKPGDRDNGNRWYHYDAPSQIGNKTYFPPLTEAIIAQICERHNFLSIPKPENAWEFFKECRVPLHITEGGFKALAGLGQGFLTASVYGNTCLSSPDLAGWAEVRLAFDQDSGENSKGEDKWENTRKAVLGGARILRERGATVKFIAWDPTVAKGLDDLLVASPALFRAALAAPLEKYPAKPGTEDEEGHCKLRKTFIKLSKVLADRVRWNELSHAIEVDDEPIKPELLRLHIALAFNLDITQKEAEMICLYMGKQKSYHPIKDYLESCPQEDPAFLDQVAPDILGVSDPLSIAFVRKFLISAVARVMSPGCKVDSVLILKGLQGAGKSSFFRLLCPDRNWFDDSFGNQSDKDERLKLHESWICEWGELEAVFNRRDLASVKAFVTCQTDKIRPPYAAKAESFHRPSVLVGTTNKDEFLMDPTGHRRFNVINLSKAIDLELLMAWRDRIWGAALAAYKSGEEWKIPAELYGSQSDRAQEFAISDTWDEYLQNWLNNPENSIYFDEKPIVLPSSGFLLEKVLGVSPDDQKTASTMRLADCMKRLGYEIGFMGKERKRYWKKIQIEVDQVDQVDHPDPDPRNSEGLNGDRPSDRPDQLFLEVDHPLPSESNGESLNGGDRPLVMNGGDRPQRRSTSEVDHPNGKHGQTQTAVAVEPISEKQGDRPDRPDRPHFDQNKNEQIQKGDRVIPAAKARWQRKGSQPLPPYLVPKGLKEAPEICVAVFEGDLFFDLVSTSRVLEVSADGQRVKVMSAGGRKSIFPIEDVSLLEKAKSN